MSVSIMTAAKAQIIAAAVKQVTGAQAQITDGPGYVNLIYAENERKKIRAWLKNQLASKQKSDINIDLVPIVMPVVIEKTWFIFAGLLLAGYLLGRM